MVDIPNTQDISKKLNNELNIEETITKYTINQQEAHRLTELADYYKKDHESVDDYTYDRDVFIFRCLINLKCYELKNSLLLNTYYLANYPELSKNSKEIIKMDNKISLEILEKLSRDEFYKKAYVELTIKDIKNNLQKELETLAKISNTNVNELRRKLDIQNPYNNEYSEDKLLKSFLQIEKSKLDITFPYTCNEINKSLKGQDISFQDKYSAIGCIQLNSQEKFNNKFYEMLDLTNTLYKKNNNPSM